MTPPVNDNEDKEDSKTTRFVKYSIFNGIFAYCIWLGFFMETEYSSGAQNVALFMAWLVSLICFFMTFGVAQMKRMQKEDKPVDMKSIKSLKKTVSGSPVPKEFDITFDLLVTIAFVFAGAWPTAIVYFIHIPVTQAFKSIVKELSVDT